MPWLGFFWDGRLRYAVIITLMATLLLASFFSKFCTVDKMVLRAAGVSFQQLPCLPFGTWVQCMWCPAPLRVSPPPLCPRGHSCDTLEQTPGRGSQGRALRPESAQGDVSRFGSTNPEPGGPGGETRSVHASETDRIYLPAFPIACFLSGENPFWQPRRWASNSCLRLIFHFNPSANGF